MPASVIVSLNRNCSLGEPSPSDVTVAGPTGRDTLTGLTAGMHAGLRQLAAEGAPEEALVAQVRETDGARQALAFVFILERLARAGLLAYTLLVDGASLLSLMPIARGFHFASESVDGAAYVLSRFAYLHRDGGRLVLESPLARCVVVCHDARIAALLHRLSEPRSVETLASASPGLTPEALREVLGVLVAAGFADRAEEGGAVDEAVALRQWEFHDLLFHARSRLGRHDAPWGGTYRFRDQIPPLPALKARSGGELIPLARPDRATSSAHDRSFWEVLEARRSTRVHGDPPITSAQLGALLYRAARVCRVWDAEPAEQRLHQTSRRPYPGGGAVYELELYSVIDRCAGLSAGLYHYDPLDHGLERVSGPTQAVVALLEDAQRTSRMAASPQVLLIVAARFQRVSWKYTSMAYALILKDVGVLYQTLYLVATALGLAVCGLGIGDSDLFARAAGTDYYVESSVGELVLGSLPSSVTSADTVAE